MPTYRVSPPLRDLCFVFAREGFFRKDFLGRGLALCSLESRDVGQGRQTRIEAHRNRLVQTCAIEWPTAEGLTSYARAEGIHRPRDRARSREAVPRPHRPRERPCGER